MWVPWRRYSAPTPFGPSNLWALDRERGRRRAPRRRARRTAPPGPRRPRTGRRDGRGRGARSRRSAGSCPTSLFASMIETRIVLSVIAASTCVGVDPAVAVDRQLDDLEAELLEVAERVADGVVLDRRGHDPVAAGLAGPGGALQAEVVGLRAAGREDDLARPPRRSASRPARGPRRGRPAPAGRSAWAERRVAEVLGQERQHRVEDLAAERGRRGVVEVDRHGRRLYAAGPVRPPDASGRTDGERILRRMRTFTIEPRGPFDLATAREFAGGFPAGIGSRAATDGTILMTFPVEGWTTSAVVAASRGGRSLAPWRGLRRRRPRRPIDAPGGAIPVARSRRYAAGRTSARRDPVIGRLQARHGSSGRSASSRPTRRPHRS